MFIKKSGKRVKLQCKQHSYDAVGQLQSPENLIKIAVESGIAQSQRMIKQSGIGAEMPSDDTKEMSAIWDEINSFEKEVIWLKSLSASMQQNIGTDEEMKFLEENTLGLQNNYQDMITRMKPLESHAQDMTISGREQIVRVSEAVASNPWDDATHVKKLKARLLDRTQVKKMKAIQHQYQLVDLQLEKMQELQHNSWMAHFQLSDELRKCVSMVPVDHTSQHNTSEHLDEKDKFSPLLVATNSEAALPNQASNLSLVSVETAVQPVITPHHETNVTIREMPQGAVIDGKSSAKSKMSLLWKHQTNYKDLLHSLTPFEIVREHRDLIDNMSNEYILKKERDLQMLFDSTNKTKQDATLNNHIQINTAQLKTFQKFVADLKFQLIADYDEPMSPLIKKCEEILGKMKLDCQILDTYSPFYAFKNQFHSFVDMGVTVIVADPSYSCNLIVPLFIQNKHPNSIVASCDTDSTISRITYERTRTLFADSKNFLGLDEVLHTSNGLFFTHVEELYSFIASNPQFLPFTHVVLHCPLDRREETDFLLSALKNCCSCPSVKVVIILMPTDDKAKFLQYFGTSGHVYTIQPPSLIFPVRTVWKAASSCSDHIQEIVETALAIHIFNPAGDVLVFLPSNEDIILVHQRLDVEMKKYNYSEYQCISVYDCFNFGINDRSDNVRYFYLAHNHAELLLLTTVSYVIDPGLKVSYSYNHKKCLEVKTLSYISRSRSKLRKHCAGRYRPGVCYRLYSRSSYVTLMNEHESPDILVKNPFDIMLKMFQFCPGNIESTDFVDSFPSASREKAFSALESANALKNGTLTTLGKSMVKLPFLPRYSKLIILGMQWGFAFEAVVLVAILLVKRSIFLIAIEDYDFKANVDLKKHELLLCDSETLTCLNVYRLWMKRDYQESWCIENYLDYKVLCKIKKRVDQIISIIKDRLKESIFMDILTNQDKDWIVLQEMVFECFADNLSVFTGHSKSGYCLQNSQSMAFLHPHSPLHQKNSLPQFVVFNNLHSRKRNIMQFVTAVPDDLILQAIGKGTLPASMVDLFQVKLERYVIENVGITVVNNLLHGKAGFDLFSLEEQLKEKLQIDQIILEPSEEKGSITLYAPPKELSEAQTIMQTMLKERKESLFVEREEQYLELRKGMNSVFINITWGKGAETIEAYHIPSEVPTSRSKKIEGATDFNTINQSVVLTWPRRLCKGYGLVSFHVKDFFIARRISMKSFYFNGQCIEINSYNAFKNQLIINGMPPEATLEDFERIINSVLPDGVKFKEIDVAFEKSFVTNEEDIERHKQRLEEACTVFEDISGVDVIIKIPDTNATIMSAVIKFHNKVPANQLSRFFDDSFTIDNLPVKTEMLYTSTLSASVNVFEAVKDTVIKELKCFEEHLSSNASSTFQFEANAANSDTVALQLLTKDDQIMNVLLEILHKILDGFTMRCEAIEGLQKLFTHGGHLWLRSTEKFERVHIIDEYKSKSLRIYGPTDACQKTVQRIVEFLNDLKNEVVVIVDLSRGKSHRKLLKGVIQKYGFNLKSFIEKFHLRFAEINIKTAELVLHGCAEAIEKAESQIEKMAKQYLGGLDEHLSPFREVCAVCQLPVLQLSIRLEQCAHLYCSQCLAGLIENAQFPIVCCYDGCDQELALEDIRKGLDYEEELITKLLNQSLGAFIVKNAQQFAYCPTPDCMMFYDVTEYEDEKWHCPLCRNDICVKCKVVYHHGYSCDMYQGSVEDVNYSYKVWLKKKNANSKLCPSCGTGIEKISGCNHLYCVTCSTHFCWSCDMIFSDQSLINNHVAYCNR